MLLGRFNGFDTLCRIDRAQAFGEECRAGERVGASRLPSDPKR